MAPSDGTASTPPKLVVTLPPNHSTLQWRLQWHHPQSWPSPSPPLAHYNGTLQWHPAMAPPAMATRPLHPAIAPRPLPQSWSSPVQHTTMAPCNDTTPSPHHSTLQWHPAMAPSNGTTSAPPQSCLPPPTIAHYNGTLQWHPAMAPRPLPQGWSSPSPSTIVRYNGTLRWHPAMAPRPLPKWFVALPPIGSKNPYSYRYLGKKSPAEISERGHYFVQRPMFYIGSTKVGVCHREYNRHTQFNRYKNGKAIQVELAIRWWASQDNYSQFSIIALKHFDTYAEAWTYEHALIEQMKAPLNHPLISKHPTRNAFKYVYKPDKRNFVGIESRHRLFRRIWGRFSTLKESHTSIPTFRLETWTVMYNLASYSVQHFATSKQLRSGKFTDTMIYGFIRLSAHVEEPERSRIRSELKNIAKLRNMTWPMMSDRPLQLPFLAHPDFSRTMKRWLKRFLRPRKANGIPFHLPKRNIREGAHSKWQIFCTIRSTGNNMTFPNQLQYLAHVRHFATTILSWKTLMDIFALHWTSLNYPHRYNCCHRSTAIRQSFLPSKISLKQRLPRFRHGYENMVFLHMILEISERFFNNNGLNTYKNWTVHQD